MGVCVCVCGGGCLGDWVCCGVLGPRSLTPPRHARPPSTPRPPSLPRQSRCSLGGGVLEVELAFHGLELMSAKVGVG